MAQFISAKEIFCRMVYIIREVWLAVQDFIHSIQLLSRKLYRFDFPGKVLVVEINFKRSINQSLLEGEIIWVE